MPHYIDAHSHLADSRLAHTEGGIAAVLERAQMRGIDFHIQGGVGPEDWDLQIDLSQTYSGRIFPCFGLHPWWVADNTLQDCEIALGFLRNYVTKGIGLGELGLDFGPKISDQTHDLQKTIFKRQLKMAQEFKKPLVLHIVHAHEPALELLTAIGVPPAGGIVHSFSETLAIAQRYLALGLTLSISGSVITRGSGKAFEKLKQTVLALSLDQMVIETDSPDQLPEGAKAKAKNVQLNTTLNEPSNLWLVAEAIGQLKQVSAETVLEASKKNLIKIFKLGIS